MSLLTLLKPLVISILDGLEFKYFNPKVFYLHNFPDIVPKMTPGFYAAAMSGFKCSWFIYLPLFVFQYICLGKSVFGLKFMFIDSSITILSFGYCLLRMMMNPAPYDIFEHHIRFYSVFALNELAVFSALIASKFGVF